MPKLNQSTVKSTARFLAITIAIVVGVVIAPKLGCNHEIASLVGGSLLTALCDKAFVVFLGGTEL